MHVLDIRDLEEILRVGAADTQSRTLALAVLPLLAVHAADSGCALFLCGLTVKGFVSDGSEELNTEGKREYLRYVVGRGGVLVWPGGDHAGEYSHDGEEDDGGLHVCGLFRLC